MIFEDIDNNAALNESKKKRTKDEWINIGAEYMFAKAKGTTQANFAKEHGISLSTFQKVLARYKNDIQIEYHKLKMNQKERTKLTKRKLTKREEIINTFRSQLRDIGKDTNASINNKSVKWFREKISQSVRGRTVAKPTPGRLYTYVYDARDKDKIPYWDKFPIIIFLGTWQAKNGNRVFNGLNLHYIPPKARQEFLEELLVHLSTKTLSQRSRLKITWDSVRGMRGSDLMIKTYLPSHVKGSLVEIDPREWARAVYLPTQQFLQGKKRYSARKVWSKY